MSRTQKLVWYAGQLMTDAAAAEKIGDHGGAAKAYLNASDILLMLSKYEENYARWKEYTDKAEYCHKKARTMIVLRDAKTDVTSP